MYPPRMPEFGYQPFAAGPTPASITGAIDVTSGAVAIGGAGFYTVRRSITNAEFLAGADIPLLNGLAGFIIMPCPYEHMIASDATAGAYTNTITAGVRWGVGGAFTNDICAPANYCQAGSAVKRWSQMGIGSTNLITTSPEAQRVRLVFSGVNGGGNAANRGMYMGNFIAVQAPIAGF